MRWTVINENRDATFYPPESIYLVAANREIVAAEPIVLEGPKDGKQSKLVFNVKDFPATHGQGLGYALGRLLAKPGQEFSTLDVKIEPDGIVRREYVPDKHGVLIYNATIHDDPLLDKSLPYNNRHVPADGRWHSFALRHGVRSLSLQIGNGTLEHKYQYRFGLRPWHAPERPIDYRDYTAVEVMFYPMHADCYVSDRKMTDGTYDFSFTDLQSGRHRVRAHWPDGRQRETTVDYKRDNGKITEVFLNAELNILSRATLPMHGVNNHLFKDQRGRIWWLWNDSLDQKHNDDSRSTPTVDSDLFCTTSLDGKTWEPPRRLPVSSAAIDQMPMLQQSPEGTYYLVWISNRGSVSRTPELWMASSPNSIDWTFARRLEQPRHEEIYYKIEDGDREFGFVIDPAGVFWLLRQERLLKSADSITWDIDEVFTKLEKGSYNTRVKGDRNYLACDARGNLIMSTCGTGSSHFIPQLWIRRGDLGWSNLGAVGEEQSPREIGGAAVASDGAVFATTVSHLGITMRKFEPNGSPGKLVFGEGRGSRASDPAVAVLGNNRFLLTFTTRAGLVATVFKTD